MSEENAIINYLDDLIGQNEKVRPVVQSGNQMLDIILGSRLGAAANAGIDVEIIRAEAPEKLPLSDADLCSLVMNIMDNAITAASQFKAADPYIRVDIHVKNDFLIFVSENSADIQSIQENSKKETVPKHGLGLKIIKDIAERCEGLVDVEQGTDNYRIRVVLPLL